MTLDLAMQMRKSQFLPMGISFSIFNKHKPKRGKPTHAKLMDDNKV
jgi:hypothetical protein